MLIAAFSVISGVDTHGGGAGKQSVDGAASIAKREGVPCYQGTVTLGKSDGAVEYRVRCKPSRPMERVGVVLSSKLQAGGEPVSIKAFEKHPTVLGSASGFRGGSCLRPRNEPAGTLLCEVRTSESVLIEGRVWVGRGRACEMDFTLTPKMPACRGNCALDYVVITLTQGPPRNC
jgi:hypothetical protein